MRTVVKSKPSSDTELLVALRGSRCELQRARNIYRHYAAVAGERLENGECHPDLRADLEQLLDEV